MKNPIKPSFKTEYFSVFIIFLSALTFYYFGVENKTELVVAFSRDGRLGQEISWTLVAVIWPLIISFVYLMFLFFPYLKINTIESGDLKENWHKAKEISLAGLFILQVIAMLTLSGANSFLIWAAPISFLLLLISLIPSYVKIIRYRHKR
jgi:hypothetical protein